MPILTIAEKIAQVEAKIVDANTTLVTKRANAEQRRNAWMATEEDIRVLEARLTGLQATLAELKV